MMRIVETVLALLAFVSFVACEQPRDTPEAAVKQFFEGLSKGDQGTILDSFCPANRGDFGGMEFVLNFFGLSTPPVGYRDLRMQTTTLDATTAEVATTGSLRLLFIEQPFDLTFRTAREGNRWYVCDDSTPLGLR